MPTQSDDTACVLIVDDSHIELSLMTEALSDSYRIKAATNGAKALALAEQSDPPPDVVLLDLCMAGMDGFETCRRLKENPNTRDAVVIFVSGQDTPQDKLRGYSLGAHDFLVKPVDLEILRKKVELAVHSRRAAADLLEQKQRATQMAMMALSSAGDLSIVIDFMRESFALMHPEAVASLLVQSVARYGFDSTLQVRTTQSTFHVCNHGIPSPLEIDMINRMRDRGRMQERARTLIINFATCSLLVKNLPEDENVIGRMRDSLCLLLEGADARIKSMELEQRNDHLLRAVIEMVNKSKEQMASIHALNVKRRDLRETSYALIDKHKSRMTRFLKECGLPEQQIEEMAEGIETSLRYLQANYELSLASDDEIIKLVEQLNDNLQSVILT